MPGVRCTSRGLAPSSVSYSEGERRETGRLKADWALERVLTPLARRMGELRRLQRASYRVLMKGFILGSVASLLLLLVGPSQTPGANSEDHFPLFPVPADVLVVCHKAQGDASIRVLCPERLPRASVGYPSGPPNPLTARVLRDRGLVGIELGYGAPYPRGQRRNNPRRFLHLAILRGDVPVAEPPEGSTSLGEVRLAGTKGNLFQAPPYSNSRLGRLSR